MKDNKLPHFPFFARDWLTDTRVMLMDLPRGLHKASLLPVARRGDTQRREATGHPLRDDRRDLRADLA